MRNTERCTEQTDGRQEHLDKYGSFLYCKDRNTLCVYMDGKWVSGCDRGKCILDDPEYQSLQKRIEKNRQAAAEAEEKHRKEEKDAEPFRDQRKRIMSYEEKEMAEIARLEERSQQAFRQNKPKYGSQLFNRARIRRQELMKWQKQNKERAENKRKQEEEAS